MHQWRTLERPTVSGLLHKAGAVIWWRKAWMVPAKHHGRFEVDKSLGMQRVWGCNRRGPETIISSCSVTPLVSRHHSNDMLLILATTLSWNKIFKYMTHELFQCSFWAWHTHHWMGIQLDPTEWYFTNCKRDLIKGSCKISRNLAKSGINSRLSLIVRVNVALNWTVVVDSDWRFDNLCSSHLQSQSELYHVSSWYYTLVIDLIG